MIQTIITIWLASAAISSIMLGVDLFRAGYNINYKLVASATVRGLWGLLGISLLYLLFDFKERKLIYQEMKEEYDKSNN